jgi:hypothetical protein
LAIATGLVVGGALFLALILEPTWSEHRELGEQVHTLEQAVLRERALHEQLEALEAERWALAVSLHPPEETPVIPWFIAHVRRLSREAGFEPSSLRYVNTRPLEWNDASRSRGEAQETPFAELRFELKARTSLAMLQEFLVRLTASPRHVRVVALALAPKQSGSQELDANLSLVALAPRELLRSEEGDW